MQKYLLFSFLFDDLLYFLFVNKPFQCWFLYNVILQLFIYRDLFEFGCVCFFFYIPDKNEWKNSSNKWIGLNVCLWINYDSFLKFLKNIYIYLKKRTNFLQYLVLSKFLKL